jgi:hypothetical protein
MALNTTFTSGQILTAAQMNNLPWGVAGYVKRTTGSFTATTSVADITGLTTTFTAVSGRLYKVSYSTMTRKFGTGFIEFQITDSPGGTLDTGIDTDSADISAVDSTGAESRIEARINAGIVTYAASPNFTGTIRVSINTAVFQG